MMNCDDIDRLMTPYVDGEVAEAVRQGVEAHLADCSPCCARADAELAARRLVRSQASTLARPAPAALRARCVGATPSSGTPARRRGVGPRFRRWVPLSMAATLLLAVAGMFMAQQERLEASFVAQLAIDHEKCFTQFGFGHPRLDATQAEARLAELGFDVSVPASDGAEQIELVDVRVCDYDRGQMAHLLYDVAGQPVSLYFVAEERHAEGTFEVLGQQERIWSDDGATCVLVGGMDAEAMDRVAAHVRGY